MSQWLNWSDATGKVISLSKPDNCEAPIIHIKKISSIHSNNSVDNYTYCTLQLGVIFICFTKLQQRRWVLFQHLDITGRLHHQQNKDAGIIISNWLLRLWVSETTIRNFFRSQLIQLDICKIFIIWPLNIYVQNFYLQQGLPHIIINERNPNNFLPCFLVSEHFLLYYTHSYLLQHQQTTRSRQVAHKYFSVTLSVSQTILKSLLPKVVQLPVQRKQWLHLTFTRTWRTERFPLQSSVYSVYPVKPFACFTGNILCLNENCLLTDFFI